nr:hypothetical protein Iba_chr13bCG10710 [Ipomoea batatas]
MPRRKECAKKRKHDVASTSHELEEDWDDWEKKEQEEPIIENRRLCEGLGLKAKVRRGGRIASMKSITMIDLNRAKLTLFEEDEEEEAIPTPPPSMPEVPSHLATVHNWGSMRTFQYQFHLEQMVELKN